MKILTTAMKTSISEVMETMFYLPVEFGEETTFIKSNMDKTGPNVACQINFSGNFSGRFTLLIPRGLLADMTENFMGEVLENLEEEHLLGTVTEMLNMVCGNALSKLGSKIPFNLDIPRVIDESEIEETQLFTMVETTQSAMAINIKVD